MMEKQLEKLSLHLDENKINKINRFISIFFEYNKSVNLVSNNDLAVLFEKHIYDSLAINLFLKNIKNLNNIKLLDIGTGGGFPSIPCAAAYDNVNIYALDSIAKKINFIRKISSELNLPNLLPVCARAEEYAVNNRGTFDIVASRAMAELRIILEYAVPFIKTGGYFIAYKSKKAEEELLSSQNALKLLDIELVEKYEYSLPLDVENRRVLLVFKKLKPTKLIYPRKNGEIKRNPL